MFKPRRHKVAVDPFYDPDYYNPATKNIIIPESAKERSDNGIIKYLGADVSDDLKIGDHVIFSGYTGTTIAVDDEILIEIHQDFIKATINTDEDEIVPGLFFKGKPDLTEFYASIEEALNENNLMPRFTIGVALQKLLDNIFIPAPYKAAAHELNIAHQEISRRIKIKSDYRPQDKDEPNSGLARRDPIDERNR